MTVRFTPIKPIPATITKKFQKRGLPKGRTRFASLRDLGREKYLEIENMLLSGESVVETARFIQSNWNVFSESNEKTVVALLKKFKREVVVPKINNGAEVLVKSDRAVVSTISSDVDIGKELVDVINLQKGRVAKLATKEKNMPLILGALSKEIKLLTECLGAYHRFKVDLGMMDRIKDGGPLVQMNVLQSVQNYNMDVQSKSEVAKATEQALKVLGNPTIDVTDE